MAGQVFELKAWDCWGRQLCRDGSTAKRPQGLTSGPSPWSSALQPPPRCRAETRPLAVPSDLSSLFPHFLKKSYLFQLLKKLINLFIFGCIGSSLPHAGLSLVGERRLLFVVVRRLLIVVASLVAEHGALGTQASVVAARELSSCGTHGLSCSTACGIFLDQGSNPRPLNWQVDS